MTIRQQKYKRNRIAGMNMYNAARAAGYSHTTALSASNKIERVIPSLNEWLEREGLTDRKLTLFLLEALSANKVIGYLHQFRRSENGITERISPDEVLSNEFLEVPDMPTRIKAAELILKIKGALKEKIEHSGLGNTIIHVYPNKVMIFKDIEDAPTVARTDCVHAEEGAESNRVEGKV